MFTYNEKPVLIVVMDFSEKKHDDIFVIIPKGRLDASNSGNLESKLLGLMDDGEKKILIDFSQLEYISSAGLRVLLMAAKRMKAAGGQLALCAMNENVKQVFDISGFSAIFNIYLNEEEGVAGLA